MAVCLPLDLTYHFSDFFVVILLCLSLQLTILFFSHKFVLNHVE